MNDIKTQSADAVKQIARDLRQEEPRSPDVALGGFEGGARVVDKCRATLVGWQGEYQFGCPFDQSFARNTGVDLNRLKEFVATGASDQEIADWLRQNSHKS
jgi:hypothetical protein